MAIHTVEEDNPLINIIVYYSLYHHVGMAMVHDDKYPHTGRSLYSVDGHCCCKENYNTKEEIQSISDALTCYGRLMCCEHFVYTGAQDMERKAHTDRTPAIMEVRLGVLL